MVEAHQPCWLLLHALFINARVPRIPSAIVVRTINTGVFIATLAARPRTPEIGFGQAVQDLSVLTLPDRRIGVFAVIQARFKPLDGWPRDSASQKRDFGARSACFWNGTAISVPVRK
jgi:hypothetical protein